jgi:hypothetical protein
LASTAYQRQAPSTGASDSDYPGPPLLNDLSIDNFVDGGFVDGNRFAVGNHACELALLGSPRREPNDDAVALGDDVVYSLIPVGERSSTACYLTLDALHSFPLGSIDEVADKVGGVQLICHGEVALAPQLGLGAEDERFVGVWGAMEQ